jgi:phospholipase C
VRARLPALAAITAAAFLAAAGTAPAATPSPTTPIEHFVVLMQENHSFDNYFGTYPGADGIPPGTCMPTGPSRSGGRCVRPFRAGNRGGPDLPHDARVHRAQLAHGEMDGFIRAVSSGRQRPELRVMAHYTGRDLPFYWNVADEYVLFDRWFATAPDGSVPNRLSWVSGTPGAAGDSIPEGGFGALPTIFDRLERRGVSWKFYVEDYDPRRSFDGGRADTSAQAVRVPLLNMPRFVENPSLRRHIVDLDEYYDDVRDGTLPAVAYIAPGGSSEHPPRPPEAGQTLVRTLLTALARSSAWPRSAFIWTYDEWGGWYDHVRPPQGRGFRVPALLVSPYARKGAVDSAVLDHTSILRFIEDNWGVAPLTRRDARANGLASAFDFGSPPRRAEIIAATRGGDDDRDPRRWGIYLWYGAGFLLSALLIAGAARRRKAMVPFAILVATVVLQPGPPAAQAAAPVPPVIETNPPTPGMRFSVDGIPFSADVAGRAHPPPALVGSRHAVRVLRTDLRPGVRARFDRWYSGGSLAAIEVDHRVRVRFADLTGRAVDPGAVRSVTLVGSNGRRHVFDGDAPQWLQGNRVVPESGGRESTLVSYAADRVVVDGTSVVHRGQQRFFPARSPEVRLRLLLFSARFEVHDALLGFPIGSAVRLEFPDGRTRSYGLGSNGELTVGSLPRGDYRVSADALGISSSRPVSLSGDQRVELRVISWLDIALVLLALASVALGLLYVRRPAGARSVVSALAVLACLSMAEAPNARAAEHPDPLFAYYYIWFNGTSWDRAKTDYPVLGRYSSDDRGVMRQHVAWAKRAGIDGFIVSWKSTPVLNRRLRRLADVADAENFKLLVIYQGLDFYREPLPAPRIARDLDWFRAHLAHRKAFRAFGDPLVIWSGTWRFSRSEVASVTAGRRDGLLILASERNVAGYRRLAGLVDGDAYYWASVNPATYPDQGGKLAELGRTVHARGGIWIPSAAPGFDARLVGGRTVVARRGGATLREELDAAAASDPDAVGLISWNEFSENTHVEPSVKHGSRYLDVVADVRRATFASDGDFDSSEPAATGVNYGVPLLGGIALFLLASLGLMLRPRLTLRR